ncbi:MAG: UDP-N-acetylmuramate dehydrogenase [Alphaproteobacteria bacterium]
MTEGKPSKSGGLLDSLPGVRGRYTENADLGQYTWFRVGGAAEVLFKPADANDLSAFLGRKAFDVPVTVIGMGSNLLVRAGGVPGVVIRLGKEFARITTDGTEITAGAGALDLNVALTAEQEGIAGFEFLSGIPGTIGGALRMNGGAYGSEIKDVLVSAEVMDEGGEIKTLTCEDMDFGYRRSGLSEDWIFISATFRGRREPKQEISRRMTQIKAAREATQPVRGATGGSTFANPPDGHAWELIEKAGCRGLTRGGAVMSEKHCNFMVNTGTATADDLEGLGEEVHGRVLELTGVDLKWEIRRIGVSS